MVPILFTKACVIWRLQSDFKSLQKSTMCAPRKITSFKCLCGTLWYRKTRGWMVSLSSLRSEAKLTGTFHRCPLQNSFLVWQEGCLCPAQSRERLAACCPLPTYAIIFLYIQTRSEKCPWMVMGMQHCSAIAMGTPSRTDQVLLHRETERQRKWRRVSSSQTLHFLLCWESL